MSGPSKILVYFASVIKSLALEKLRFQRSVLKLNHPLKIGIYHFDICHRHLRIMS